MPSSSLARVLSVDDDADAGEMLGLLLKSYGIEVTCAHSALEAWPMITAEAFDLYLLDAWLPQLDGFELCRRLRDLDPVTPILFFSGAAYPADKQKGLAAGANGYVVKPELDDLLRSIKQLVSFVDRPIAPEIHAGRMPTIPRLSPAGLGEPVYVG